MADILIVDDRHHDRKLVADRLSDHGYQVTAIADAVVTCTYVRSLEPDMVLLNALSSRFDCLQMLIRIKRYHPELPVIAYTVNRAEAVERIVKAVDGLLDDIRLSDRKHKRRRIASGLKILKQFLIPQPQSPPEGIRRPACRSSEQVSGPGS